VRQPPDIAGALLLELRRGRCAAGAELDPDLGLGLQARALDALHQPQHVVGGDADKAGRDLEEVEAHARDLVDVALDGLGAWMERVVRR
jgi:hypothetical protein